MYSDSRMSMYVHEKKNISGTKITNVSFKTFIPATRPKGPKLLNEKRQ